MFNKDSLPSEPAVWDAGNAGNGRGGGRHRQDLGEGLITWHAANLTSKITAAECSLLLGGGCGGMGGDAGSVGGRV